MSRGSRNRRPYHNCKIKETGLRGSGSIGRKALDGCMNADTDNAADQQVTADAVNTIVPRCHENGWNAGGSDGTVCFITVTLQI
jgi:hypothetical protein